MAYVIDASVAMKWFFDEPHRNAAKKYLHYAFERIAPDIIIVECVNALRKRVLLHQLPQEDADRFFAILLKRKRILFSEFRDSHYLIQDAYSLSKNLNQHPIPDCLYLALAKQENVPLVTADIRLYEKVNHGIYANLIKWVEEPPRFFYSG